VVRPTALHALQGNTPLSKGLQSAKGFRLAIILPSQAVPASIFATRALTVRTSVNLNAPNVHPVPSLQILDQSQVVIVSVHE